MEVIFLSLVGCDGLNSVVVNTLFVIQSRNERDKFLEEGVSNKSVTYFLAINTLSCLFD